MERKIEEVMDKLVETMARSAESGEDEANAKAMADCIHAKLTDLGYPQEIADDVAETAMRRLIELCRQGA